MATPPPPLVFSSSTERVARPPKEALLSVQLQQQPPDSQHPSRHSHPHMSAEAQPPPPPEHRLPPQPLPRSLSRPQQHKHPLQPRKQLQKVRRRPQLGHIIRGGEKPYPVLCTAVNRILGFIPREERRPILRSMLRLLKPLKVQPPPPVEPTLRRRLSQPPHLPPHSSPMHKQG